MRGNQPSTCTKFSLYLLGPELEGGLHSYTDAEGDLQPAPFVDLSPVGLRIVTCPVKLDVRAQLMAFGMNESTVAGFGLSVDVGWIQF